GAIGGELSTAILGGSLGKNILFGAVQGAAWAAVGWGAMQSTPLAQGDAQRGGGSGEAQAEADGQDQSLGGKGRRLSKSPLPGDDGDQVIQWKLDRPSDKGGWIIQHVTETVYITDLNGNIILSQKWEYWEGW